MTFILNQLCFAAINVFDAWIDKNRIADNVRSKVIHWINAILYTLVVSVIATFANHEWNAIALTFIASFFNRQLFFDIPLNLFRGLKWDYVTNAEKPAWTDRVEIKLIGDNGKAQTIIYAQSFIITILIYFI